MDFGVHGGVEAPANAPVVEELAEANGGMEGVASFGELGRAALLAVYQDGYVADDQAVGFEDVDGFDFAVAGGDDVVDGEDGLAGSEGAVDGVGSAVGLGFAGVIIGTRVMCESTATSGVAAIGMPA
ncbi:MAG TPA: hypothetical protein VF510_14075 [Ktedonobacterales bacterium]